MPTPRIACLALALAGALATGSASAGGDRQLPEACKGDASTLCPGMAPGDGKLHKCLKENRSKVSEACRKAVKQARAGQEGKHAASGAHSGGGHGDGEGPDDE